MTKATWILFSDYGCGMEPEVLYDNRKEALEDLRAYRENDPNHFHDVQVRHLRNGQDWQNCRYNYNR